MHQWKKKEEVFTDIKKSKKKANKVDGLLTHIYDEDDEDMDFD